MNTLNVKFLEIENRNLAVLDGDYFTIVLEKEKSYEKHFTAFANLVINEGDVVMDFGANLGYHTITMASFIGNKGKIHSFEPQRIIFQQLNCNVFLNGLDNVYTYNLAIGESESEVFIDSPDFHNIMPMYTNIGNTSINTNKMGTMVKQISLDSLKLSQVNFIKMDVQGSELNILKGGKNTILKYKPFIFIEIEERQLKLFNITSKELINYTKQLGYEMYRIFYTESNPTDDYICIPIENKIIQLNQYPYTLVKI
jgi:FkbM family methyltransferase